jgi:hypothetical protein
MATDAPLVIASWDAPPWAEACTTDEDAVIYSRVLGRTVNLNGGDMLVELVQRDELGITANTVTITRPPAYLRVAGELIAAEAAACFARMLMTANDLIDQRPDTGKAHHGTAGPDQQNRIAS